MTIGRPPELAKLPNEYWRSSDERPGQHLIHHRLARLARVEHGAGLHHRRVDRDLGLAVHAVHVDRLAELIVDGDADPDALLDGFIDARLGDGFGSRDVDLVLLHDDLGGVAANDELVALGRRPAPTSAVTAAAASNPTYNFIAGSSEDDARPGIGANLPYRTRVTT